MTKLVQCDHCGGTFDSLQAITVRSGLFLDPQANYLMPVDLCRPCMQEARRLLREWLDAGRPAGIVPNPIERVPVHENRLK